MGKKSFEDLSDVEKEAFRVTIGVVPIVTDLMHQEGVVPPNVTVDLLPLRDELLFLSYTDEPVELLVINLPTAEDSRPGQTKLIMSEGEVSSVVVVDANGAALTHLTALETYSFICIKSENTFGWYRLA